MRRRPQARRLRLDPALLDALRKSSLLSNERGDLEAVLVFDDGVGYAVRLSRRLSVRLRRELEHGMTAIVALVEADVGTHPKENAR